MTYEDVFSRRRLTLWLARRSLQRMRSSISILPQVRRWAGSLWRGRLLSDPWTPRQPKHIIPVNNLCHWNVLPSIASIQKFASGTTTMELGSVAMYFQLFD